jgi:hypothetical protein
LCSSSKAGHFCKETTQMLKEFRLVFTPSPL